MMIVKFISFVLIFLISTLNCSASTLPGRQNVQTDENSKKPILLIISYDGFRNEYLNRNVTPNLLKFRKEGVYTDHMINVFPTKTFPNHHSISTGYYPNVHGVLANSLFDKKDGYMNYSYELFHYNETILPIWVVNEMAGGNSGCMMWPGSDFQYGNITCTHTEKYNSSVPLMQRVDIVMNWLTDPVKPANLVMFYSEQPDKLAHKVGPDSEEITKVVASLDLLTKYIQDQLAALLLENRSNVLHLSDHGMAGVVPSEFINLTDYLQPGTYKMYGTSPVLQVVPTEGNLDYVYETLRNASLSNKNFDIYKSEDLPNRWEATNQQRFGPIIAVAKMNYGFQDLWNYKNITTYGVGVHGYDNEEELMYPIFMAKGPSLKSGGLEVKPFETVDLFSLFMKILSIEESTIRNSSAVRILDVLADKSESSDAAIIVIVLVSIGAILAVIIYAIKFHRKKHSYSPT